MEVSMKSSAENTQPKNRAAAGGGVPCAEPVTCQLSRVRAGMQVRIKELSAPPAVTQRLREIGFGEQQVIKLLVRQSNLICQVPVSVLEISTYFTGYRTVLT